MAATAGPKPIGLRLKPCLPGWAGSLKLARAWPRGSARPRRPRLRSDDQHCARSPVARSPERLNGRRASTSATGGPWKGPPSSMPQRSVGAADVPLAQRGASRSDATPRGGPRVHSPRRPWPSSCPVCPLVLKVASSCSSQAHLATSARTLAAQAPGPVSGRLSTTISRRALISPPRGLSPRGRSGSEEYTQATASRAAGATARPHHPRTSSSARPRATAAAKK
jgi:hypothetical protein